MTSGHIAFTSNNVGGDPTVIGGTSYSGSVRQVSPATGACMRQTGLPCAAMGTPSLDGAGMHAAGTRSCPAGSTPGADLIDAAARAILKTLSVGGGRAFSQPVLARGTVLAPTETQGLDNFAP